jgi:hypothetical protein
VLDLRLLAAYLLAQLLRLALALQLLLGLAWLARVLGPALGPPALYLPALLPARASATLRSVLLPLFLRKSQATLISPDVQGGGAKGRQGKELCLRARDIIWCVCTK